MNINQFGNIDPQNLEEYYDTELVVDGNNISVDINFESEAVDAELIASLSKFLESIEHHIRKAFAGISEDYDLGEESETARFYLQHHLDEFSEEEIKAVFGTNQVDKETFMQALSISRIGLYPEDEESYAIFDIQLSMEYTDYLMAVTFDSKGDISYISMDS